VFREFIPPGEEAADVFTVWERIQWEMLQEPYAAYAEILEASFERAMDALGFRCPRYATEAFVESVARWEPFPDVNPALIRLSQRYKLAIISNIDRTILGSSLRRLAVRFDMLMTAEDAQCYKPNPAIFQLALKKMDCAPDQVAHVAFGAAYDLAPASGLGMRAVYLNREGARSKPLPPIETEITGLDQLISLWETHPSDSSAAVSRPGGTRR
jgi:2-haloalkanoic acid dehalogenase type II